MADELIHGEYEDPYAYESNKEPHFFEEIAITELLRAGQLWLRDHPDDPTKWMLLMNCNDVFAWGCADCEEVAYTDIKDIWDHFAKDKVWGTAVWVMKKRNEMPQKPVETIIRKEGIWDLDAMRLGKNITEEIVHNALVRAAAKPRR